MTVPVRSCCFMFSLRQGTMLIAVVELLVSAILLFLLLLASAHAQEMAAMLEADIQDTEEREGIYAVDDTALFDLPPHRSNNEIQLRKAQHLALVMIIALYTGIATVTIHLISCVLLLYGAMMQVRHFLLPWVSTVLIGLAFGFTGLLVSMLLGRGTFTVLLIIALFIQFRTSVWLVVFSFYRQLYEDQASACANLAHHDATTIKAHYLNFPPNYKPSDV